MDDRPDFDLEWFGPECWWVFGAVVAALALAWLWHWADKNSRDLW